MQHRHDASGGPVTREQLLSVFEYPEFQSSRKTGLGRFGGFSSRQKIWIHGNEVRLEKTFRFLINRETQSLDQARKVLKAGDWVGYKMGSNKNSISELVLLAPCLAPASREFLFDSANRWDRFLTQVRVFFKRQKFLEAQTPTLVTCPGTEPFLTPFSTDLIKGRERFSMMLPTSPELSLKKLLAAGMGPLFEIKTCFRNDEMSHAHEPEFTMLEWYRPGANLTQIQKDCVSLVEKLVKTFKVKAPRKVRVVTVAQLFAQHVGIELTPTTTARDLSGACARLGLVPPRDSDFDDLFFFLFLEKIESKLDPAELVFVCDYPPSQAALARLTAEGWGDRFEMYWKGLELANAFHELNDPKIQRQRANDDLEKKKKLGLREVPLDSEFFTSLESGMPPSAGIALGLERLVMALFDLKQISDVRPFSIFQQYERNLL